MSKQTKFRGKLNRQYFKTLKIRILNRTRLQDANTKRDERLLNEEGAFDGIDLSF